MLPKHLPQKEQCVLNNYEIRLINLFQTKVHGI